MSDRIFELGLALARAPDKRDILKTAPAIMIRAIDELVQRLLATRAEIAREVQDSDAAPKKVDARAEAERRTLERTERDPAKAAREYVQHVRGAFIEARSMEATEAVKVSADNAHDAVVVGGRSFGDYWHHELEGVRREGLFISNLAALVLSRGTPSAPVRVRDFVTAAEFERLVTEAIAAAGSVALAEHRTWIDGLRALLARASNQDWTDLEAGLVALGVGRWEHVKFKSAAFRNALLEAL